MRGAEPVDLSGPASVEHQVAERAAVLEGAQQQVALGRTHRGGGEHGRMPELGVAPGDGELREVFAE